MSDMLVVASKVRAHLKMRGVKMSGELPSAVNKKLMQVLDAAADRARANRRSTVKPQDA